MSQEIVGRRYEVGPETTTSYALKLFLLLGSIWFVSVLLAIVFGLGTMI